MFTMDSGSSNCKVAFNGINDSLLMLHVNFQIIDVESTLAPISNQRLHYFLSIYKGTARAMGWLVVCLVNGIV